jgi:hypothetical protein
MTGFFRLSKLAQSVIDHREGRVFARRRVVGALGFRVGPVLLSISSLRGFGENKNRTYD